MVRRRAISLEVEEVANDQGHEGQSEGPPQPLVRATHGRAVIEPLASPGQSLVSPELYMETLSVLVTLIEQLDQDRGGHSMKVARVCQQLAERIGLTPPHAQGVSIAAYLHDVGVSSRAHVTALDVAKNEAKRAAAQRAYVTPGRLFESVTLPEIAVQTLRHRFERFDGKGFPDGLVGKDIPLGARVLTVAESYVDLTLNRANARGGRQAAEDACNELSRYEGTVFDPEVVGCLRRVVVGDGLDILTKTSNLLGDSLQTLTGGRGVSGSLQEMALADVIQVLANGRKSGRLEVTSGTRRGEMAFHDGAIHDARLDDLRGADAVYAILRFTDGSFSLVPDDGWLDDVIGIPTHHLLLEAMRRLDEEQR